MKILKRICIIFIFMFAIIILTNCVNAASASISASSTSTTVNNAVTITASTTAGAWNLKLSGVNLSKGLVGQTSTTANQSASATISFVPTSAGTYTFYLQGDITDYDTDIPESVSKSITVTVTEPAPQPQPQPEPQPEPQPQPQPQQPSNNNTSNSSNTKPKNNTTTQTKSNNSKLATLQIAEGIISPEFSSSEKEYTITVPNEVTTLSISAIPDSSKATVDISGNEELEVGENTIKVVVKAEDGSTTTYTVVATRAQEELNINSLNIYYINENGEKVVLTTTPAFAFNVYEYSLEKLPYTVKELVVEATSNKENAKIEITGNSELKEGKNQIIVKATVLDEESGLEEIKTYTISVEKEAEPVVVPLTFMQKIKNIFNGTGISKWISNNLSKIISGMLFVATIAFVGLTIYFAYDYKKYQGLIAKLAEYNKENLMERANVALNPEILNTNKADSRNVELSSQIEQKETMKEETGEEFIDPETAEICAEIEEARAKIKRGKRYKE